MDHVDGEDTSFDYDHSLKPLPIDPSHFLKSANAFASVLSNQTVMGSVETVLRESYKFIRLADDLHDIKYYLNDIRLCFIALTISGYVGAILYGLVYCFSRRRDNNNQNNRRGNGPYNSSRHLRAIDEEMQMGGNGGIAYPLYDSAFHKPPPPAPSASAHQGHNAIVAGRHQIDASGRYTTRSLNRTFQNSGTVKLDGNATGGALDGHGSPSKKHLLENHAPSSQQHLLAPYNDSGSTDGAGQPLNRENGGIAQEA